MAEGEEEPDWWWRLGGGSEVAKEDNDAGPR